MNVVAYFGLSHGAGSDNSNASGSGDSYNYSFSASAKSSSSANGDLYFKIKKGFSGSIPATQHIFFIKTNNGSTNSITTNSILNILNNYHQFGSRTGPGGSTGGSTVGDSVITLTSKYQKWPTIRMVSENVVLIGGSQSRSNGKSQSASASLNGSSNANSQSISYDVNVSTNSVTVPEALHENITISKQSVGTLGGINVPYSVNPSELDATIPSVFPTGSYLISSDVSLYKFGYSKVSAITADITSGYV